ncbi:neural Wiskott-Aldrich syndrome protein-like [Schistocerca nitens]|uniref:neural Wiskott-Aldrich syndrome protein-like n=1 Tax=Schistocerca nitens TaxID=7011 RepID=UPI0021183032|nr:neural Wiskott-Aldrich syndrome protein-like [Schistocerca nitens]
MDDDDDDYYVWPFLEYGPPPDSRTTPPPPPPPPIEKRLKYVSIAKPVIKYQTAKPLPPVTPPPSPPPPPPPPPPQKPKPPVRPHLVYGPPPEFQTEKPSLPSPPLPPPPQLPVRPYDSAEQTAIPEPPHRFSLPASDHHKKRHFVKRDTDNAITSFLYRFVDDGSAFDERGQLKLNAHDKTLGSYAYRYVGTDGVTVDVSRTPAA